MTRKGTRLVQAGKYVAEVLVERSLDDGAWGPYLSLDDALKLERVERALRREDLKAASQVPKGRDEAGCGGVTFQAAT